LGLIAAASCSQTVNIPESEYKFLFRGIVNAPIKSAKYQRSQKLINSHLVLIKIKALEMELSSPTAFMGATHQFCKISDF
jgi:hypothetical protein